MSDPYKNLERQLGDAVRRRAAAAGGVRGRRARWTRGALPTIAAIAVLGTGAATAAVVLGPDDQPDNQVKQALMAGERAARASLACRHVKPTTMRLVNDPVPARVLAQLGVLRRPASARDQVPRTRRNFGNGEVLAGSIRVARASDGWSYRLFLSRGVQSFAGTTVADPLGCAQSRRDASVAAAARFDADGRARVARTVDREVAFVANLISGRALSLSLMEMRPDGRPNGGGATIIRNNKIPATGGIGTLRIGHRRYVALSGLVPDGVVTVRVVDGSGSPRERAVKILVADNVFHALLSRRMGPRMTVEWRAADGSVIRRTHPRY
ncbi:MAG: hypothetical protein JWM93_934 [Frankiales bacterium]|nr:hypothetical protein [Frankiales bacterium]